MTRTNQLSKAEVWAIADEIILEIGDVLPTGERYIPSLFYYDFLSLYIKKRKINDLNILARELSLADDKAIFYIERKGAKTDKQGNILGYDNSFTVTHNVHVKDNPELLEKLLKIIYHKNIGYDNLVDFLKKYRSSDPYSFLHSMKMLFPNIKATNVAHACNVMRTAIEYQLHKQGFPGASSCVDGSVVYLLSKDFGGTGKGHLLSLFDKFEAYINLISMSELPSKSFPSVSIENAWSIKEHEYEPFRSDEGYEKIYFNKLIDGQEVPVEEKFMPRHYVRFKGMVMLASNTEFLGANNRRIGTIEFNHVKLSDKDNLKKYGVIELSDREAMRHILTLYLTCPFGFDFTKYNVLDNSINKLNQCPELNFYYKIAERYEQLAPGTEDELSISRMASILYDDEPGEMKRKIWVRKLQVLIEWAERELGYKYVSRNGGNKLYNCIYSLSGLLDCFKAHEGQYSDRSDTPIETKIVFEDIQEAMADFYKDFYSDEQLDVMLDTLHNNNILFNKYPEEDLPPAPPTPPAPKKDDKGESKYVIQRDSNSFTIGGNFSSEGIEVSEAKEDAVNRNHASNKGIVAGDSSSDVGAVVDDDGNFIFTESSQFETKVDEESYFEFDKAGQVTRFVVNNDKHPERFVTPKKVMVSDLSESVKCDTAFITRHQLPQCDERFNIHMTVNEPKEYMFTGVFKEEYLKEYLAKKNAGENVKLQRLAKNLYPLFFVYEMDKDDAGNEIPFRRQLEIANDALLGSYGKHIFSVTHSGNKSIHILVRIDTIIEDRIAYAAAWRDYAERIFGKEVADLFDTACKDIGRLTRTPNAIRSSNGRKQACYYMNEDAEGLVIDVDRYFSLTKRVKKFYATTKSFDDKTIEEQFEFIVNKRGTPSARLALDIYKNKTVSSGENMIGALSYAIGVSTFSPQAMKFKPIAETIYKVCKELHPSNITKDWEFYWNNYQKAV